MLQLTDALAAHLGLTHWGISMRLTGKGDFLNRALLHKSREGFIS